MPTTPMTKPWSQLQAADPEVFGILEAELARQREGLELIASENFASQAVISACANAATNKYAEGRPSKRYYGGCEEVDRLENLAIERATSLFSARFANVQPHSGAQANAAAFLALLDAGDRILGMDLSHGGHLTHGSPVNFSGRLYDAHFYTVDRETERLDMDAVATRAREVKPKLIVAGASAYSGLIDFARFREIADEVGAYLLVDMAHIAGLVATGHHPSPVPHAHVVTTTTHKTLRGPRGGLILWNDEELSAPLNKGVFPGTQGGPLEHIIAAKAVAFKEAQDPSFAAYQERTLANACALAAALADGGFRIVSGGTENHLVLVDLSQTDVSGKVLEEALGHAAITVNKNTVPRETRSPFVTSGVRFGTPALTTRGFGEPEMVRIAQFVRRAYTVAASDASEEAKAAKYADLRSEVLELARAFPLYIDWG